MTRWVVNVETGRKTYGRDKLEACIAADLMRLRFGLPNVNVRLSHLFPATSGPSCRALADVISKFMARPGGIISVFGDNQPARLDKMKYALDHPEQPLFLQMVQARSDEVLHALDNVAAVRVRNDVYATSSLLFACVMLSLIHI